MSEQPAEEQAIDIKHDVTDPTSVIREWIKRNRPSDQLTLSQFNGFAQSAAAGQQPGEGMIAWLGIAFAAGREYGETKQSASNASLVISRSAMVDNTPIRRHVTFRAQTGIDDYLLLLATEMAINRDGELRAHVTMEE